MAEGLEALVWALGERRSFHQRHLHLFFLVAEVDWLLTGRLCLFEMEQVGALAFHLRLLASGVCLLAHLEQSGSLEYVLEVWVV